MAIDFNAKTHITNPTAYSLGRGVIFAGIMALAIGAISWFTTDIIMPATAWFAVAVPTLVTGIIMMKCSRGKS